MFPTVTGSGVTRSSTGLHASPTDLLVAETDSGNLRFMAKATRGSRKQSKTSRTAGKSARGGKSQAKAKAKPRSGGAAKSKGAARGKTSARKTSSAGRSSAARARRPRAAAATRKTAAKTAANATTAGSAVVLGNETDRTDVDWAERAFSPGHEAASTIGDPAAETEDSDSTDE